MRNIMLTLLFLLCTGVKAERIVRDTVPVFKYRVSLTDKNHNDYSLDNPEEFLSPKALERRRRQGISVDESDLPLTDSYIKGVTELGVEFLHGSKWNNSILVQTKDTSCIRNIRQLEYVREVRLVANGIQNRPPVKGRQYKIAREAEERDSVRLYGKGSNQIMQMNGISMHEMGFRGKGIVIAVIDGGFRNLDIIPAMQNISILGKKDFVNPADDMFAEADHGTKVLSCMATNQPNIFIGTAPEASYWIIRSEDTHTEQPVEEDNWMAAVEYADSVGVDIINSSLGYTKFDNISDRVQYEELDGVTHPISRIASMLASKGIILCTSAGNEGSNEWKRISIPADARDVLTVGAVDILGDKAPFSSEGNTEDGRIKPDVCALGAFTCVINASGHTSQSNGTSFASPSMAGMVACLWQALPDLNAYQIMDIVRKSGNNAATPDCNRGYGIPDFIKALNIGKSYE